MTAQPPTGCPGIEALERALIDGPPDDNFRRHVERCESCREQQRTLRENLEFMDQFRRDLGDQSGDAAPAAAIQPPAPDVLPGYILQSEIARGGQATVYQALQVQTQRRVAVKMIDAAAEGRAERARGATPGSSSGRGARARQRLEREAAIAAGLRHPNIVTIYHSASLPDGRFALAMEFIDGVPIDEWTPPGQSPQQRLRELLRAFITIAGAVHHAHLNGVIHRDLKPDNILITREGRPVVLDFGVAKAERFHATLTGEFAGTPAYASPEQVSGKPAEVNALTDVYSLGVILYRLICGAMPHPPRGSLLETIRAITDQPPIPPRRVRPSIPVDLEAILLCALARERSERYQSAAALARDLERFLAGAPVEARSASAWYVLRKALVINRRRLTLAAGAAGLLIAAGTAVIASAQRARDAARRELIQRREADAERVRAIAVTELLREALPGPDPARPELAAIIGSGLGNLYYRLEQGEFADRPEVDQALRRLWGSVYTGLGSAKAAGLVAYAEASLRNGLVQLRLQHSGDDPQIAMSMHQLAGVLLVRQRLDEALTACRDALAMWDRLGESRGQHSADSRALMARIHLALGKPDLAWEDSTAALERFRALSDRDQNLAIASMTALRARIHLDAGRAADAEPLALETIQRRVRSMDPEEPELLASLTDAAAVARALPGSGLAARLAAAWETPPDRVADAVLADISVIASNIRGDVLRTAPGRRTAALGRLARLVDQLPDQHERALLRVLTAQIRAAIEEGDLRLRARAAQRAAEVLTALVGPDDPSRLVFLEEAVVALAYAGLPEQAVPLSMEVCRIRELTPAPARDVLIIANSRRTHAWCLTLAGRWEEARAELEPVLASFRAAVGDEHHLVGLTECHLALCLANLGDLTRAETLSAHSLALSERLSTFSPDQVMQVCLARGHVLRLLGRAAEARPLLQRSWDAHLCKTSPRHIWRRIAVEDLLAVCEQLGDAPAAAAWREIRASARSAPADPDAGSTPPQ